MKIKSVFVTRRDTKFCAWCHKPIPKDRQANAKYCSDECSKKGRKGYRQKWYQQKKSVKHKQKAVSREIQKEIKAKKIETGKKINELVNSGGDK